MKILGISLDKSLTELLLSAAKELECKEFELAATAATIVPKLAETNLILVDAEALRVQPELLQSLMKGFDVSRHQVVGFTGKSNRSEDHSTLSKAFGGSLLEVHVKPLSDQTLKTMLEGLLPEYAGKFKLDVSFINPFIKATVEAFTTFASITPKRKSLFVAKDSKLMGDISGVMGVTGRAVGTIIVTFPERLARQVVANMLGIKATDVSSDDIRDGVGEMINVIAGSAKRDLESTPYYFKLSIPTVIEGANHTVSHQNFIPSLVVLFEAEGQEFQLHIGLKPRTVE